MGEPMAASVPPQDEKSPAFFFCITGWNALCKIALFRAISLLMSEEKPTKRPQTIATVERAADVLTLFARTRTRDLGVTDIANQLKLSKAVVHRILMSLRGKNFIDFNAETRRYRLGPAAVALGLNYLNQIDVRALAHPELQILSAATQETATLSIRTGTFARVYIDQVKPDREIVMSLAMGVPYALHSGASSKAFLAHIPDHEMEAFLKQALRKVTPSTVTDPKALREEIARIRRDGYAASVGERESGAAAIAAPVFDHNGRVAAVISLSGPTDRFRPVMSQHASLLRKAAAMVSLRLGYNPETAGATKQI